MNSSSVSAPVTKTIVLLGAGNAHLVFLKRWSMRSIPGVALTLVSEASVIPYSAMVPGHIGGEYSREEITIDLVRLCQAVGARLVAERATRVDPAARRVVFADRVPISYNVLSVGVGSLPACPLESGASLAIRPMKTLLHRLDELEADLRRSARPFHFAVVGGGASGCELALALHKRLGASPGFRLTLLQAADRLLPQMASGAARAMENAFRQRGILFRLGARVTGGKGGVLTLERGEEIPCDGVLWATDAAPPELLRESGLATDPRGFLRVKETLQSVSDPAVFGSGDCVSFDAYPELPKNGVYAVREGAVLFDNVAALLHEKPLRPFRPQRLCVSLMNTADGEAILSYGPLTWKGRRMRRLKDRIDRAWIDKFTRFPAMSMADGKAEPPLMRCGGCGSKISSDVLSAVLKRLEFADDPRVLLGCRSGEDAAVHRIRPELFGPDPAKLVEVQTVDFFKAFVDDPYLFGRIAALHALSDLHAMNARPFSALAIVTLPYARGPIQEAQLYELLSGAVRSFREMGVTLTGGHTTESSELALGFAVTGYGEEDTLFQKSKLRPGDRLILTKPLGSGALLAAWMRGECRADWFEAMKQSLLQSNGPAGEVFRQAGVEACTDITGFGLAGHLFEMLDASHVSARLRAAAIPLHAGFAEVVSRGIVSTLHEDNAKVGCRIRGSEELPAWLFDPQTSGGLLGAVKPEAVGVTLEKLRQAGYEACEIGDAIPAEKEGSPILILNH